MDKHQGLSKDFSRTMYLIIFYGKFDKADVLKKHIEYMQ